MGYITVDKDFLFSILEIAQENEEIYSKIKEEFETYGLKDFYETLEHLQKKKRIRDETG